MENEQKTLNYTKEDIKPMPEMIDAVVVNITKTIASEVFGDKADNPAQEIILVHCENKELNFTKAVPFNYFDKDKVPPKSKLGEFINKYNELKAGITVNFVKNSKGYYDVLIN